MKRQEADGSAERFAEGIVHFYIMNGRDSSATHQVNISSLARLAPFFQNIVAAMFLLAVQEGIRSCFAS